MTPSFLRPRRPRDMERAFRKLDRKLARLEKKRSRDMERHGGSLPGPRNWSPAPQRRQGAPSWMVSVSVVALVLGGSHYLNQQGFTATNMDFLPWATTAGVPPAGVEAAREPLGSPPLLGVGDGYEFLMLQDDNTTPVTWDPCRPIHYVTSGEAPPGTETLVVEAVEELRAATGLTFVHDGATQEIPTQEGRSDYQPEVYGKQWAPILVAWTTEKEVADLGGNVAGIAGPSTHWSVEGEAWVHVSGTVYLDQEDLALVVPEDQAVSRAIILHEFMHALGLDHVSDPTQVMYAEANPEVTQLGEGDRRGLSLLGQGACYDDL